MESSALDYVAQACMDLSDQMNVAESDSDRETLLTNHIKKVSGTVPTVDDFKNNLEWVNVSEAISLSQHCSDKVVVLDFWTYCCINCYHVLPDLAHLESVYPVEKGLVVIGVHCAKFDNEKSSSSVLAAVQRYNIQHPVVNDQDSCMWEALGIRCWPTLLVLGPNNKPLFIFTGEGHRDQLVQYVGATLKHFNSLISTKSLPISPTGHLKAKDDELLCFPSKVAPNPFYRGRAEEPYLAISDTGHHRVVLTDCSGVVLKTIGGPDPGLKDGSGKCLALQALSSPWDILLYTTPDMDMSVRPLAPLPPPPGQNAGKDKDKADDPSKPAVKEKSDDKRRVLLIACAGSHQIWALFLDTTIWWKYKTYTEGTNPEVFIADSESSSIRRLALTTGQVSTLCGGDRNPLNLFAFGDIDDIGSEAKLQHPLCVAYSESSKCLFVADTYNNKIKKVDISTQKVTSLKFLKVETTDSVTFCEPSGLSLSSDGKYLYVADTNNHSIKLINTTKNVCQDFKVRIAEVKFVEPENLILYKNDLFINRKCGNLIIYFNVNLDTDKKNVKFSPSAPQNWQMSIRDENNKDVTNDEFEFINCSRKGFKLPGRVEIKLKSRSDKTHYRLYLAFNTSLCDVHVCFSHRFTIRSTILVRDSVKMIESYKITCKVNPVNRYNVTEHHNKF
ncbi:hypothetical protein OBRU01_04474 [Operophtera brumata]|uniref:Thioredoxin domain-containing protein n=1 Tax=Operophtera brumata TaxID=104452 RepID=A0A0L7LPF4_OPEBR|nr:hypothetical protein OBRU01_04474 [Operophtera brumata]